MPSFRIFDRKKSQHLKCTAFAENDTASIQKYIGHGRLKIHEDTVVDLDMECPSIRHRIHGDIRKFEPLERRIAHIRNAYRFYEQQEVFLSISYHPENVYCYAIDVKSKKHFKSRMRKLATCFPNIHILDKEYDFLSTGHLQDQAHMDCLKTVMLKKWSHALLLQSDDMIMKNPYEISKLSATLRNVSLVENQQARSDRFDWMAYLTPAALGLFKNELTVPDEILHKEIFIRKNSNQVFLSRPFVTSIFEKLNLEGIINYLDDNRYYGIDEMLFATLYFNYLGLDSQIQSICAKHRNTTGTTHRYVVWPFEGTKQRNDCFGNYNRHGSCVFGVEYLPILSKSPAILANKPVAYYDFGTVICMRELIRKGTVSPIADSNQLLEWPQYREMLLKADGRYNKTTFRC